MNTATAAATLHRARREGEAVPQLSSSSPFDLPEAYRIQADGIALRVGDGEALVGVKLGLTSRAKMQQVGVSQVIFGQLTDAMAVADGGELSIGQGVHPRAEPEVAFRLGRAIAADEPLTAAIEAVDGVCAAVEVIDSRYANFQFTVEDVVADNASAAAFVVGPWRRYGDDVGEELGNRGVLLEVDGVAVQVGSTAAILGDPRWAIRAALELSRELGVPLRAGDLILAGAATAAVPLAAGQSVRATVAGLGSAGFQVVT